MVGYLVKSIAKLLMSVISAQSDPIYMVLTYLIGVCKGMAMAVTLSDRCPSCPRSLVKTTPPPPGYPWVTGDWKKPPEPEFKGFLLDH